MKRFLAVVGIVGMLFGIPSIGLGQDVREWPGHMFMRPLNPTIRFNGTLIFKNTQRGTQTFLFGSATGVTPHLSVHNQQTGIPLVTNCGTTSSVDARSNDAVGVLTTGSGAGGANCTIVFAVAYASAPVCGAFNRTAARAVFTQYSNATAVSFQGQTAGDVLGYHCIESQ